MVNGNYVGANVGLWAYAKKKLGKSLPKHRTETSA